MPTPIKWGSEFLVNTITTSGQFNPSIQSLANGRFIVTWNDDSESPDDNEDYAVRGQIFDADGDKFGGEFLVNTITEERQGTTSITSLADGRFVVTWTDESAAVGQGDESNDAVRGQMFNIDGTKSGDEFLVNTITTDNQSFASVSALVNGGFVVTWQDRSSSPDDNSSNAIRAQIFDADGNMSGAEFLVNTTIPSSQHGPKVATLSNGDFVISWTDVSQSVDDSSSDAVRAQVFNEDGLKSGAEFLVNTETLNRQDNSRITALADGRFVIAWDDFSHIGGDAANTAIKAQVFNPDGSKSGTEFLVNTITANDQEKATITGLNDGRFVIAWQDSSTSPDDASSAAIRAQVFNVDGSKSGSEFLVNTTTDNGQTDPNVTALADGRFVVTWEDGSGTGGDTDGDAIRAQIFDPRIGAVTLNGSSHDDDYVGSVYGDVMRGSVGDDVIFGKSGDDILEGEEGNDKLYGGTGNDRIDGGSGDDRLKGYKGDDRIEGGSGDDDIFDQSGNDIVKAGSGKDYIRVGGGADSYDGGSGTDYISYYDSTGGVWIDLESNVVSRGWANNDTIKNFEEAGGSKTGDDKLKGTSGDNRLKGYGGDDKFYGRGGDDKLYGGDGEDYFDGGAGADLLYGGDDADTFHFDHGEDNDTIKDFENNVDTIELDNFGFADSAEALTFAVNSGGDVIFNFGGGDVLIVENASKAQLVNDIDIV